MIEDKTPDPGNSSGADSGHRRSLRSGRERCNRDRAAAGDQGFQRPAPTGPE